MLPFCSKLHKIQKVGLVNAKRDYDSSVKTNSGLAQVFNAQRNISGRGEKKKHSSEKKNGHWGINCLTSLAPCKLDLMILSRCLKPGIYEHMAQQHEEKKT